MNNLIFLHLDLANDKKTSICKISFVVDDFCINKLINPHVKFDDFNKKYNKITEPTVSNKPNFKEVFLDKINKKYLTDDKYIWVGYNIKDNAESIAHKASEYNVVIPKLRIVCINQLFQKLSPKYKRCNIEHLCEIYKIELGDCYIDDHKGCNKALACKKILEHFTKERPISEYLIESLSTKLDFKYPINEKKYKENSSKLHKLTLAIQIQVFLDLKQNKFNSDNIDLKLQKTIDEFNYLNNHNKHDNYEDFIKNIAHDYKTIKIIYFQVLLSYFACNNIIEKEQTKYILKWLKNIEDNLKNIYPFSLYFDNPSKYKLFTNKQANEFIILINENNIFSICESSDKVVVTDNKKDHSDEIKKIELVFEKLTNSSELYNKKFCLTGEFKLKSKEEISEYLINNFYMTEGKREMNDDTNFLIIGSLGKEKWLYEGNGPKIKKALTMKEYKNNVIKIISEEEINKIINN